MTAGDDKQCSAILEGRAERRNATAGDDAERGGAEERRR